MQTLRDVMKYSKSKAAVLRKKYKKDAKELDDSFLYVEDVSENEGNITYSLRWVVRDYARLVAGRKYRCHNIRIGNSIHNLRIFKQDTKVKVHRRLYFLLGLTPSTSCANVSFVLTDERNEKIQPEDKGTVECILPTGFSGFSKSRVPKEYKDLPALCTITVAKSISVSVGIETSTIHRNFKAIYGNELFSDVKICVEGKEFNVHKVILAARSPVFLAMLRNEMRERSENRIEINDSNQTAIAEMLRYFYYEETIPLTVDLALDLFELADKYDIPALKSETVNFLKCNFSVENIFDILVAADLHHEEELKTEAIEFVSTNLRYLLQSPKWRIHQSRLEIANYILEFLS